MLLCLDIAELRALSAKGETPTRRIEAGSSTWSSKIGSTSIMLPTMEVAP